MKKTIKLEIMTIVHGQSEYKLCTSIKSNLRIKHEIIARNKGKSNIQITSIMDVLNGQAFKTLQAFKRNYSDVEVRNGKLINFKLFIIMDVDDCTEEQKKAFYNKSMFKDHWLYDYIVPIYNRPNLEETMRQIGINVQKKSDYITIFPTNHGDLDMSMAKSFYDKLASCKCSNLDEYVSSCIGVAQKYKM